MNPLPSQPSPEKKDAGICKHPRVQIVAREDDAEFVQCIECGDVFESSEFRDMNIEESKLGPDSESEPKPTKRRGAQAGKAK